MVTEELQERKERERLIQKKNRKIEDYCQKENRLRQNYMIREFKVLKTLGIAIYIKVLDCD